MNGLSINKLKRYLRDVSLVMDGDCICGKNHGEGDVKAEPSQVKGVEKAEENSPVDKEGDDMDAEKGQLDAEIREENPKAEEDGSLQERGDIKRKYLNMVEKDNQ